MDVKDIIKEGRPDEPEEYTYSKVAEYNYKSGVHDGYDYAIEETRKQMIDKALEWMRKEIRPYYSELKYKYDDFVKAMEE